MLTYVTFLKYFVDKIRSAIMTYVDESIHLRVCEDDETWIILNPQGIKHMKITALKFKEQFSWKTFSYEMVKIHLANVRIVTSGDFKIR